MARPDSVFVDTGVWYSAILAKAESHTVCDGLLEAAAGRLLTTDYVIDELVTLMIARGHRDAALGYVPRLLDGNTCQLHHVDETDFAAAWRIVQQFADKRWSFTDCTSYAVMQRLGVREALSLDDHFRQFGFVEVRP